jgi:hypothetical protein
MVNILYRARIWFDTTDVIGVDAAQEAARVADFETHHKSGTTPCDDLENQENMIVQKMSYEEFDALIDGTTYKWSMVLLETAEKFYDLYLYDKPNPTAADGTMYVRVTEKTVGKYMQLLGFEFNCPAGQTTNYDVKWTVDIELTGARAFVSAGDTGSKANLTVVDKDNILGYGAGLVITQFGKDVPSNVLAHGCEASTTTAATIGAGLYVRIQYVNNGVEDRVMYGVIKYYK